MRSVVNPAHKNGLKLVELLYHGGYDEVEYTSDDSYNQQHCKQNADCAHTDMQLVFYELYYRIKQIGHKPCNEERQKYVAQLVDQQQNRKD